jgi:hypothetical protein
VVGLAVTMLAPGQQVITNSCLNCGLQYVPGSLEAEELRVLSGQRGEKAKEELVQQRAVAAVRAKQSADTNRLSFWIVFLGLAVAVVMFSMAWSNVRLARERDARARQGLFPTSPHPSSTR